MNLKPEEIVRRCGVEQLRRQKERLIAAHARSCGMKK